jgi:hypothetical protein
MSTDGWAGGSQKRWRSLRDAVERRLLTQAKPVDLV